MLRILVLSLASVVLTPSLVAEDQPSSVQEFKLPTIDGSTVKLAKGAGPTLVLFLGTECPLAKQYAPLVQKLVLDQKAQDANKDAAKKLQVIGIASNRQDSLEELKVFAKLLSIKFKIAKDFQNKVADQFGATRTPEVFLLDSNLNIVYRGRVDDQYSPGITRKAATKHFLRDALSEFLAGGKVSLAKTEPVGCLIGKVRKPVKNSTITYCNQVSRLLQKHCIECHRTDELGPFALTDYDEVVGWSDMMVEVIEQKRMPPWHASPDHGEFQNSRVMPADDKDILIQWVKNGSPYGDPKDLPPAKEFTKGWALEKNPDRVLEMGTTPYEIPAQGIVEYQYFVVDPKFKEDKWIKSAQILPGNRSIVHHSIVFVRPPDGESFRGIGWLTAYVPGQKPIVLPNGHARRIPAGSKLVFQQHYTTTGKPEKDLTKVGLIFADEKDVKDEVFTIAAIDQEFEIPPHAQNHLVKASVFNLPKTGKLLAVSPHMHLRGKSFRAINQKGKEQEIICDVPAYDFNWQHIYAFRKPIEFSDIGKLNIEVRFDNSANNPVNPDPSQTVTWGDQTYEEMAIGFLDVSVPRFKQPDTAKVELTTPASSEPSPRVIQFADKFFKRYDKNKNGLVERDETPVALRGFGFWKYDSDRDGRLTREEVINAAKFRMRNSDK